MKRPFDLGCALLESPPDLPAGRAWIEGPRGRHLLRLEVADRFWSRFRGLMLRPPLAEEPVAAGLLLIGCASIHTAFMRYPIDVVYLDGGGQVTSGIPHLKPWRASAGTVFSGARTRHTLELPAGSIARLGIAPGAWLRHPLFSSSS